MFFYPRSIEFDIDYITPVEVVKIKRDPDGCICVKCKDFILMAEPNQEDKSFICYSCRENPYR